MKIYREHTIIEMDHSEIVMNRGHSKKTIIMIVMLILLCSCVLSIAINEVALQKKQEPKNINSEFNNLTNFNLFELVKEIKKINLSNDYSQDSRTRDVSKINTAVDAASYLVGIIQMYFGNNKQKISESPVNVNIVINNNSFKNNSKYEQ
ncbi:uncharacterized protein LOC126548991 [Aphis gossypii]|uniref:uncharacterized protein LOC126548991 n=1 Tax=Aphis gossypii TaxID=80765 RepID=UPI0021590F94|nr:uncharacterized protein LOC126548991 [Aphis gossypii]